MISQITRCAFVHSLVNPPSLHVGCDIDLILNNSHHINLIKKESNLQTKYVLSVSDPLPLGLLSGEDNAVKNFFENLILAFNLNLRLAAMSVLKGDISQIDTKFKHPEAVKIEETLEGKRITISDTVFIKETVYITIKFAEEVDEKDVLTVLRLVNELYWRDVTKNLKASNLRKALTEYGNAMKTFDRLMIFKHLFNSLELAVNWDGKDRRGEDFVRETAAVTGFQTSDITAWKDFYNRTKHVDREPKEIDEFISGMTDLPSFLEPLRSASNKAIISRLKATCR